LEKVKSVSGRGFDGVGYILQPGPFKALRVPLNTPQPCDRDARHIQGFQ